VYFIRNFNQVLCVTEAGDIRWSKETMRPQQVFVYDERVVIWDMASITAFSLETGVFEWSYSRPLMQTGHDLNTGFFAAIPDKSTVVVLDTDSAVVIDVKTGIVRKKSSFKHPIDSYTVSDKGFVVCAKTGTVLQLYVFDQTRSADLHEYDFGRSLEDVTMVCYLDGACVLKDSERYYIFNCVSDTLFPSEIEVLSNATEYIDYSSQKMFRIESFKSITCYDIGTDTIREVWRKSLFDSLPSFAVSTQDNKTKALWYHFAIKETPSFRVVNKAIMAIGYFDNSYVLVKVDMDTGTITWKRSLSEVDGFVNGLSQIVQWNDVIIFILSSELSERSQNAAVLSQKAYKVNLKMHLYTIDFETGEKIEYERLIDGHKYLRLVKPELYETKGLVLYNLYGQFIRAMVKR
jgi:outer membrane protein assembly factor BamB